MRKFLNISLIIFTISFTRFVESAIKKIIFFEVKYKENEVEKLKTLKNELEKELTLITQEIDYQNLKKELQNLKDFYLEINRKDKVAYLKIEDKVLKKMDFEIFQKDDYPLPMGILQVIMKQETTYFPIPDYYYQLLGKELPKEEERIIKNGLSPYLLSLGEKLILCGPFHPDLPKDLVPFNALIFSLDDMKVIFYSLKENSKVLFY
jgi:hypothetical protein